MKKVLILFVVFLLAISMASCRNTDTSNESTTFTSTNNSSQFLEELSSATATQNSNELTNNKIETDIPSSESNVPSVLTSNIHSENSAPQILFLTLDDIAAVETAFNKMEEDEFNQFISEHPKHYEANGINNRSDAKKVVDELKETTIFLLDGNKKNVSEMYFYLEQNKIQQPVFLENDKKIICTYYTPQNNQRTNSSLDNNPNSEFIDEFTVNGIPIKIYQIQNNTSHFAELIVDNTSIFCRITNMENVDEIKTCFSRITFVKIGDLLDE